jgi:hypothetical protein
MRVLTSIAQRKMKMIEPKPLANTFFDGNVSFKLATTQGSVEILDSDLVDTLAADGFTFCVIRAPDDHVRCLIYKGDELVSDVQYCFPQSHEVIGEDCFDIAAYRLAEMFFASYLAERIE